MRHRPDAFWNSFTLLTIGFSFALTLCLLLIATTVIAQEGKDGPPATVGAADSGGDPEQTIVALLLKSGWLGISFMAALGLFSLVGLAVTLERLVNLRRGKVIPGGFAQGLATLARVRESNSEIFGELCEDFTSPMVTILRAGLLRAGRPLPEVEKSMEDAAAREMAALRSRARPLGVIGSVAPLIGLLGTVVGMIFAFQTASQEGIGKAELLAEGIYLALLTTAAGLSIAIPALLFAAFFNARAEKYMREIDEQLMEVMPCFAKMERAPVGRGETPAANQDAPPTA